MFLISSLCLLTVSCGFAQSAYKPLDWIRILPENIKHVDTNNDGIITFTEAKEEFDNYMNNPHKALNNDIVRDVEATLFDLINYVERKDFDYIKNTAVAKEFLEYYYDLKYFQYNESGKTRASASAIDSILIVSFLSRKNELKPSVTTSEAAAISDNIIKQISKTDSTLSGLKTQFESNVKITGMIDTYYSYDINNPSNGSLVGSSNAGRVFDRYHNKLMLSLAQTKFAYTNKNIYALVDLTYGLGGEIANYGNAGTSIIIKQVFLTYTAGRRTQITIGNFGTHVGYEVIEATNNFNYSVSNLFANGPFYHTGIKADYTVNSKIGLMGGLVSGWDKIQDDNKAKTIIGQFSFRPYKNSVIYLNWIGGNEAPSSITGDSIKAYKQLFDLTAAFPLLNHFNIGINAAYGINNFNHVTKTWGGAALYLQYRYNSNLAFGLRSEYFDDSQKVQYLGSSYTGHTFTIMVNPIDNLILKIEARYDCASQNIYWKGKNNDLVKEQTTFGVAVIGKF